MIIIFGAICLHCRYLNRFNLHKNGSMIKKVKFFFDFPELFFHLCSEILRNYELKRWNIKKALAFILAFETSTISEMQQE
jgi:hypothetical protein